MKSIDLKLSTHVLCSISQSSTNYFGCKTVPKCSMLRNKWKTYRKLRPRSLQLSQQLLLELCNCGKKAPLQKNLFSPVLPKPFRHAPPPFLMGEQSETVDSSRLTGLSILPDIQRNIRPFSNSAAY